MPTRRAAITAGFRAAGCQIVAIASQLEAIVRLGESHFEPDIVAVASTQPVIVADEMRAFVAHYHPSSMLVAIGPELLDPAGFDNWLSEATATADLPARIRELLFAPRARQQPPSCRSSRTPPAPRGHLLVEEKKCVCI